MRGHLEAAANFGEPWDNFIAPIVTYPGPSPRVDTWIVRLDTPAPIKAETIWETAPIDEEDDAPRQASSEIDEILDLLILRPDLVTSILQRSDRLNAFLRSYRARDERQAKELVKRLLDQRRGVRT